MNLPERARRPQYSPPPPMVWEDLERPGRPVIIEVFWAYDLWIVWRTAYMVAEDLMSEAPGRDIAREIALCRYCSKWGPCPDHTV